MSLELINGGARDIHFIEWVDAVSCSGWHEISEGYELHRVKSVGFMVHEDEHSVTIACAISDGEANATMTIPKGWIKHWEIIGQK